MKNSIKKKSFVASLSFVIIATLVIFTQSINGSSYNLSSLWTKQVKNVIVLVPDGCSATHITTARWYKGEPLALDEMISGGVRAYGADSIITDSAPAATAFATGWKTSDKFIGVLPDSITIPSVSKISDELKMKPVATVLEGAKLNGKAVGLIATSNIQHATPAAYSAHWPDRNF